MTAGGVSTDAITIDAGSAGLFAVSRLGPESAQRLLKQRLLKEPDMFVVVRMPDGTSHRLEALEGWRVMEVIRDWGLPIKAECGGACACATCHVWVDAKWLPKLNPPTHEELEMLDGAFHVDERSRLCCQIIMSPELDGLELELAPESLADAPQARLAVGT
jgi:ferredoxin, 2Fe-2S